MSIVYIKEFTRLEISCNMIQLNFRLINWLFEATFSISFQLFIHFRKSIILRMESDNKEFQICYDIYFKLFITE